MRSPLGLDCSLAHALRLAVSVAVYNRVSHPTDAARHKATPWARSPATERLKSENEMGIAIFIALIVVIVILLLKAKRAEDAIKEQERWMLLTPEQQAEELATYTKLLASGDIDEAKRYALDSSNRTYPKKH